MNQREFYETPEVKQQLDIQRKNPYGSEAHKRAFYAIANIAKKYGVYNEYINANGGSDY